MTFSGFPPATGAKRSLFTGWLLAAALVLAGCTAPAPNQAPPAETAARPPAEPETLAREPATEAVACPEPEPVEPVVCPPPPAPKPCPVCPAARIDGKLLVGAVEYVKVTPPGVVYEARMDTGAAGSSIHASNIVRFERDGEKWVRFDLNNPKGEPYTLERQVLRRVKIRQPGNEGYDRRV